MTTTKTKPKKAKKAKATKPLKGGKGNEPASDEPLIPLPKEEAKRPTLDEWKADAPPVPDDVPKTDQNIRENMREPDPPVIVDLGNGATLAGPASIFNPANAYDSPEALQKWDTETANEAEERRRKRSLLWSKEEASKATHKADKAAAEEYDTDFFDWLRERNEQRGRPPQPQPARLYPDPDVKVDGSLPNVPAASDEAWKATPLSSLDLSASILEKLANAEHKDRGALPPITTMGELTAYQEPEASGWQKKLTDLKGIGAGAAEKIGDACIAFWDKWNKEGHGVPQSASAEDEENDEEEDEDTDDEEDDGDASEE